MGKKILLPVIFIVLGYGFWVSPDFKVIAAGVAVFLLGMLSLEEGFKAFTGGVLEKVLHKTTNTTTKSLTFGIVSTTLMQSSSLVSVITISFISAGLIALTQGVGIILGANLGTTTGAWLVAGLGLKIDIAAYAMPMLVFGVILSFQKNSKKLQGAGYILSGLGLLFLGIAYMKEGFEAVGEGIDLSQFAMGGFKGLLVYTGIGIAATVVMQSSHATLILTITALAAQQVTYENALALAIGSNVGTTITAVLGALSANIAGKRLAGAHLIFNVTTGLLAIVLVQQFILAVDWSSEMLGIAADNYTLKFAVFHTLFNLVGVMLMLPVLRHLVGFLERFIREEAIQPDVDKPRHLNDAALELPDTALEVLTKETLHLADNTFEILAHGMNLHRTDILSSKSLEDVVAASSSDMATDIEDLYRRKVKPIYSAIITYAARAQSIMNPDQVQAAYHLKVANRHLVDAIKFMKEMQDNLSRYTTADDPYAQREYNTLRLHLARLLRALFGIEEITDLQRITSMLEGLKVQMEADDVLANGTLDKLVRDGLITPTVASSLMNDTAYAYNLHSALIAAAEIIFAKLVSLSRDTDLSEPELDSELARRQDEIAVRLEREEAEIDALKDGSGAGG